jgi:hypothetical protein
MQNNSPTNEAISTLLKFIFCLLALFLFFEYFKNKDNKTIEVSRNNRNKKKVCVRIIDFVENFLAF